MLLTYFEKSLIKLYMIGAKMLTNVTKDLYNPKVLMKKCRIPACINWIE